MPPRRSMRKTNFINSRITASKTQQNIDTSNISINNQIPIDNQNTINNQTSDIDDLNTFKDHDGNLNLMTEREINDLSKLTLINIIKGLLSQVEKMSQDLSIIKRTIEEKQNETVAWQIDEYLEDRIIDLEKRLTSSEQYSRRECIELVNIPDDINQDALENKVIDIFHVTGTNVTSRDFHAVHRLRKSNVVIVKLVNQKDALSILRSKKKLRDLDPEDAERLNLNPRTKIYVNESLCWMNKVLLGKCNSLYKMRMIQSFYTYNGAVKIKLRNNVVETILHNTDLIKIFGNETVNSLVKPMR